MLTGCQSGAVMSNPLPLAGGDSEPKVTAEELRAFCPPVMLEGGAAFTNDYAGGAEGDPEQLIRQVAISDVTRACAYGAGTMTVDVAVAGRVVPGQAAQPGAVTVPIRVEARRGAEVLYSQVHNYPVQVTETIGATQFIFSNANIALPQAGAQQVRIFVGLE